MLELIGLTPWGLLLLMGVAFLFRWPRLKERAVAMDGPRVSIIVPARNEAANIGQCLSTLLRSSYTNREIIVVDDRSTDGTGDIVRALEQRSDGMVRLVEGAELPAGWYGKPWACWQGYQAATGAVLLFTDADTRHEPDLLGRAMTTLQDVRADLLTVLPEQVLGSFWERSVMPHILFMLGVRYQAPWLNRTRNPKHVVANGQFIMMPRASYEAIGGHQCVQDEVVEDLRLAQIVVEKGMRLHATHAEEYMTTRMYRSLGTIVEGWTKNVAIGAGQSVHGPLRAITPWAIVGFLLTAWVVPPAILLAEWIGAVRDPFVVWALGATILSLTFWMLVNVRMKVPPLYSLIYPLGALVSAIIVTRSALRGRRVVWKGRTYGGSAGDVA